MEDFNSRNNRQNRKPRPDSETGSPITPFNRTGKLPPMSGTAKLPPLSGLPEPLESSGPQASPFVVRLDPHGKPGEFNFVIDGPEAIAKIPQAHVMEAEASGGIPPVLFKAVDEVLGFIYGLDQQFENQGRRPRK